MKRFVLKKDITYKDLFFQEGNIGTIIKPYEDRCDVYLYEKGAPVQMTINKKIMDIIEE